MATNKFKITFEPVIILVLTLITLAVFILEAVFPGLSLDEIFVAPTSPKGLYPFSFTDPLSYVRIFTHIFGTKSVETWAFLAILFFITPEAEEKYGTFLLILMMLISVIFSGALCACFCTGTSQISGIECIFCMVLFLRIIDSFKSKSVSLNLFLIFALFILIEIRLNGKASFIPLLINTASGISGSLISFLAAKKERNPKASTKKPVKSFSKIKKIKNVEEIDEPQSAALNNESDSPRFKKKTVVSTEDDDTTIVGTITL
ncbi:MAG: rhomboid family intramembrane serine protease [Treponema sp.]|nr:rhomboid family intramembrane serine protease [Treponema sp.]